MKIKTINTFAVIVILMIVVPEVIGHSLFDRTHPANSSVNAAIYLTNKIGKDQNYGVNCNLIIKNDPSGSQIARAAGLEGKYGDYSCI